MMFLMFNYENKKNNAFNNINRLFIKFDETLKSIDHPLNDLKEKIIMI
jgi:hypothetical protein